MHNNRLLKGKYRIAIVVLIFLMIVFEGQSIKFAKKQSEKKPAQALKQAGTPKTDNGNKDQQASIKTAQQPPKVAQEPAKQPQTPKEIKPEVSTVPTATSVPQQKQAPKTSKDKSLDGLFGQSTESKPKQVPSSTSSTPAMKITAEQHTQTAQASVAPQTPVTSTQTKQKTTETNSGIGGLFGDENNAKPKKTVISKNEDKPALPEVPKVQSVNQPVKPSVETKTQTSQTEIKDKKTEQKEQKVQKQPAKTQSQQQKKNQKQQEESSGDVYYPASKKPAKKADEPKPVEQKILTSKRDDSQDQVDQQTHTSKAQQQQSQSQQIIYSSKSKQSKKTSKQTASAQQQNPEDAKQKYSLTLFLTFCLYSLIIVLVVITIKCTSSSTKVVKAVGIMLDAVGDMFKKKQGYRPALNEEEITEREEEITVGYNVEENNKQIFWEKNSVEGI